MATTSGVSTRAGDRRSETVNDTIQSKLAINIAQLSLDKATLEAHNEALQQELAQVQAKRDQLLAELDKATAPTLNNQEGLG